MENNHCQIIWTKNGTNELIISIGKGQSDFRKQSKQSAKFYKSLANFFLSCRNDTFSMTISWDDLLIL